MRILFARHGNTFDPGDKVVWVGRETDLPLVEKGRAQAEAAGRALAGAGLVPTVIYAASLKRTREFAAIVAKFTGAPEPVVDERLDEIDYGPMGGLSTEEIEASNPLAKAELEAWGEKDVWPEHLGWKSTKAEIVAAVASFAAARLAHAGDGELPLVVSSNGILRFLPRAILSSQEGDRAFKLRTGGLGLVEGAWGGLKLKGWDIKPEQLPSLL